MRTLRSAAFGIALVLALAIVAAIVHAVDVTSALAVPQRANSSVSLASNGSFVVATWSARLAGGQEDIYVATSRDGGQTFPAPVRVNATGGDAFVNGEQPPRVALVAQPGSDPQIDVMWVGKRDKSTPLKSARSVDGGKSFGPTAAVPGSEAVGLRGWHSITADSRGNVLAAWLDHRRMSEHDSETTAMHHHDAAGSGAPATTAASDGTEMAQLSQLYFATFGGAPAHPVTSGVCFCCKTAIASGPGGEIYIAWRHVYPGNLRDIAFTASRDGGRTFTAPVRISEDKWAINGCPEDGPVLAVDRESRVHAVWPTVVSENGDSVKALFHAVTRDGQAFSARVRLPSRGQANHPQMALAGDGSVVIAWDESGDGPRRIALARGRIDREGGVILERLASANARAGSYPALASLPQGVMLAWTAGDPAMSTIRIEAIR
jgi:hypothetical protein